MSFDTPVALFVFNRPEHTRRVFAEIRRLRPRELLVVADGPREGRPLEAERCRQVQEIVAAVDWECRVHRNYAEANLGCRRRVSSGLDWVFSLCDRAIILEDDCLPRPEFFPYCAELLERYADDERVMHIAGSNPAPPAGASPYSYRFSRYNLIWGWATWRRAWRHYDLSLALWPELRNTGWLSGIGGGEAAAAYWRQIYDTAHAQQVDTWDYQWMFATWVQNGVAIVPRLNLISNIGFGEEATHTTGDSHLANLPTGSIELPLAHPPYLIPDVAADRRIAETYGWAHTPRAAGRLDRLRARLVAGLPPAVRGPLRATAVGLRARLARRGAAARLDNGIG